MFKNLFKKHDEPQDITVYAPITGKVTALEEVPDPVFSQKMMGEGVAIEPDDGTVYAPVDGTIIQLFETKHAIGIRAENGAEILIHIGLDTVELKGDGFTAFVAEDDHVKTGDKLLTFDIDTIKSHDKNPITPIIVTNKDDMGEIELTETDHVQAGEGAIFSVNSK
ncbi:PTS system beta-glucoside-specific EIIBCA component [Lentibacillus sp. JNUCC-1]|uniref:PTS sugar transporter subunit IIA n=1 Tax=Lentibacillus sp. JNUCC-1 TaxID=2654513 RepID=UPI0012E7FC1C|nr:PTS glucose transporter subunit IIA [Lentibacillus sp. JNUCC-1]MUV36811.1 PTS system beta-glucoside-specific EIIBCA component [Lentibacillus sp. JNUCC-1]